MEESSTPRQCPHPPSQSLNGPESPPRPVGYVYDSRSMTFVPLYYSRVSVTDYPPVAPASLSSSMSKPLVVPASLTKLMSNIPEHVLNYCCEDVPLADIASMLHGHETIYMYLEITDLEMEDIATVHQKPLRQRQVLLRKWKEKHGSLATYKNLIECFQKAHRTDLISVTCKVLQSHYLGASEEVVDFSAGVTPDIDEAAERTAFQQLPHVPPQDPLPDHEVIPFQKQQQPLQILLGSHGGETEPPQVLTTTQPSEVAELESQLQSLDIQRPIESEEDQMRTRSMSPQLNSLSSTHSSDSSLDSFKTAFSHLSPTSTPEESDEETTKFDTADFMQQLQFITEGCKERFFKMEQQVNKLKQKLKEKDEELIAVQHQFKQKEDALKQRLAEKEQQLATQIPYPQQETEPRLTELETKLRLTQEHLKEVEDERKSLAGKLFDAEERVHDLKKQLLNTKIQLITSHKEAHDHKMENIRLKQHIQNRIDFIFESTIVCSRRRAQSV